MARSVILSPVDNRLGAPQLAAVGYASAAATSVAIPTHQIGDLILVFAYRDGSTTVPSKPSASGTVPAWSDIESGAGANTNSCRLAYFVATATNTTTGTWTSATGIAVAVLRGQAASGFIGAHTQSGGSSNSMSYGTLSSMTQTDGSSWVLGFGGHRSATNMGTNAPSGMTVRTSVSSEVAAFDLRGTSSWSAQTASVNASSGWRTITVEIVSARGGTVTQPITDESGAPTALTFTAMKGSLSLGTAYLFVTNPDGLTNASGYLVTLTAGSSFQSAWARGSNVVLQGV